MGIVISEDIPIKQCTRDELGLDEGRKTTKFFKTHPNSLINLDYYWKKLNCFDYEKMKEFNPPRLEV